MARLSTLSIPEDMLQLPLVHVYELRILEIKRLVYVGLFQFIQKRNLCYTYTPVQEKKRAR